MQHVRDFGCYPKASKHVASRERRLAQNLREARKEKLLSPEQESELQVLQQAEMDSRAAARISEAQRPLDPMERFAGESESRITPHRMAKQKEYDAAYYQKNKARLAAYQKRKEDKRKYDASPHGKARKKEYNDKRQATPHRMAKQKEYERKYDATPQGKAREVPGHPAGQSRPEDEAGRRASDWCNASTQTW